MFSVLTEIFFQFEINAKMDISKNQLRSTGGEAGSPKYSELMDFSGQKKLSFYTYRKVASSNTSRFEAHAGFFRLLMKEIFKLADRMRYLWYGYLWYVYLW